MTTTTAIPSAQRGLIEWPGSEPLKTTRQQATDTLRACAFLREPVRVWANGRWTDQRDVPRPFGLTEAQATIVQEQLLHRIHGKLQAVLPPGTPTRILSAKDAAWDVGWMMEVGDGWTIGPTVETTGGYRAAIRWHAYDPEGNPLAELVMEQEAAAALAAGIVRHKVATEWILE